MIKEIHHVTTAVKEHYVTGDNVKVIVLKDPDGWQLPPFTAGAHVEVFLPSGKVRQYSVCSDPENSQEYRIAVRRDVNGRGGSTEVYDDVSVGDTVLVSLPHNYFPLVEARRYLFIAGGIGVTPFMSMIPVLDRENADYTLHYTSRCRDNMPFFQELQPLIKQRKVIPYFSTKESKLNIETLVGNMGPDTHLYCCGPSSMIEHIFEYKGILGDRLHIESFGAQNVNDIAYDVELLKSGRVVPVAAGQTMLQALRSADVDIPASCEAGVCLQCRTKYTAGTPIHRDLMMDAKQQENFITPCVSGCASERIVLDI